MKTIEYYKTVDKSDWSRGPWDDEPDKKQWLDEETGLPCLIVRNHSGALCGYVGVDKTHPYFGKDYNHDDLCGLKVHVGLNFADVCQTGNECESICHKVDDGENDRVWWLGFDCAHSGDFVPKYVFHFIDGGYYKTIEYVTEEIKNLAKQLKEVHETKLSSGSSR